MLLILLLLQIVLLVSRRQLAHPHKPEGLLAEVLGCATSPLVFKEKGPGYATESSLSTIYHTI